MSSGICNNRRVPPPLARSSVRRCFTFLDGLSGTPAALLALRLLGRSLAQDRRNADVA